MKDYGACYESRDKTEYGVFSIRGKNLNDAYSSALERLRRDGKVPSRYKVTVHGDEDEEN